MQKLAQSTAPMTDRAGLDPYGAATHEVFNQPHELADYNLFVGDAALRVGVAREGAGYANAEMEALGASLGAAASLELGALANRYPPELDTHDRYGQRVDLVRFHPAYHALMGGAIERGLHASPWTDPGPGAPERACRARRPLLHAGAGRSGAWLPDHHDLRRDPLLAARARSCRAMAAEDPFASL